MCSSVMLGFELPEVAFHRPHSAFHEEYAANGQE